MSDALLDHTSVTYDSYPLRHVPVRAMDNDVEKSPLYITRMFLLFAVSHSLLASKQAKDLSTHVFGQRHRNGLYRFLFNAYSTLYFVVATVWFLRLPDRELYHVRGMPALIMRSIQAGSLALAVYTAKLVGLGRITGLAQLREYFSGRMPIAEPEAQGPRLGWHGALNVKGTFRFSRHPLNLFPLGIFWLFPRMTVNLATLAALSTVYLIVGSMHEEARIRAAYGWQYQRYTESNVPFYIGLPAK